MCCSKKKDTSNSKNRMNEQQKKSSIMFYMKEKITGTLDSNKKCNVFYWLCNKVIDGVL